MRFVRLITILYLPIENCCSYSQARYQPLNDIERFLAITPVNIARQAELFLHLQHSVRHRQIFSVSWSEYSGL